MYFPTLLPSPQVFKGPVLDLDHNCLCGKVEKLRNMSICWTHPIGTVDDADYKWVCICSDECYTRNIIASIDMEMG